MATRFLKKTFPLFIILTTICLFFYPIIFTDKTYFFRDFQRLFYPFKYFLAAAFKNSTFPFWCPHTFCGGPFSSFLPNTVFYPLSLVFLFFKFPFSLNLFIVLHFLLGFWFFYLFITAIGLSRKAAVVTGISYCYGSYTISSITVLSHLSTLIWIPAILWSYHQAVTQKRPGYSFITVLFLCMALLGGAPQLLLIIAGLLFLGALTWEPAGTSRPRDKLKNVCLIGLLLALSAAITMVQLGPLYVDYLHSIRLDGLSYPEATKFSLNPESLKHLIVPLNFPSDFITNPVSLTSLFPAQGRVPWLLTIYPGFLILPLALLGTVRQLSMQKAIWVFAFLLGILLALGNNTPFYRVFYALFPSFRFPEKCISMASFSLLVLAAYGFDHLSALIRRKGGMVGPVFIVFSFVLVTDLYIAHRHLNPVCDNHFYSYRHPEVNQILKDQGLYRIYVDDDVPTPAGNLNTIQNTQIQWQTLLVPNLGLLANLSHVGGVTGLELNHQYFITELLLKPWPQKINFLRLTNVKYIISTNRLDKIPGLAGQLEPMNSMVYRVKNPLPRAWVVGKLAAVQKGVLEELSNPSFDMRHSALTWGKIVEKYQTQAFEPVTAVEYRDSNTIHIELTAERPGILVLSESTYPGWRVQVDGIEKDCLRLNYLFQGVEIEKGRHRIDFIYQPHHFFLFLSISIASVFMVLLCWVGYVAFSRKKQ